ncbi:hypothetical protein IFM89_039513, partial [Coptis chinensis]
MKEKKKKFSRRKRKNQNVSGADVDDSDQLHSEGEPDSEMLKCVYNFNSPALLADKSKKAVKKKKKDLVSSEKSSNIINKGSGSVGSEVYQISSVDVDCSKGMKKWITNYYQSRPSLKILQERIDEFIISHEAQKEQVSYHTIYHRKEKEALSRRWWMDLAVDKDKGREENYDAESGTTMGSVALVILEKMGKKKSNDLGLNFYKFQRKEAQRN